MPVPIIEQIFYFPLALFRSFICLTLLVILFSQKKYWKKNDCLRKTHRGVLEGSHFSSVCPAVLVG